MPRGPITAPVCASARDAAAAIGWTACLIWLMVTELPLPRCSSSIEYPARFLVISTTAMSLTPAVARMPDHSDRNAAVAAACLAFVTAAARWMP